MQVPSRRIGSNVGGVTLAGVKQDPSGDIAIGRAVEGAASGFQEMAQRAKIKADVANVNENVNGLFAWGNEARYGENGLYSKKGKNAFTASDEMLKGFDDQVNERLMNMKDENQKALFSEKAKQMRNSLSTESMQYQARELQAYEAQEHKSYLTNQQIEAQNHYSDPARVDAAYKEQINAIQGNAIINGLDEETVKLQQIDAANKTFGGVVDQYVNGGNFDVAQQFLDSKKDLVSPEFYDKSTAYIGRQKQAAIQEANKQLNEVRERTYVDMSLKAMNGQLTDTEADTAYENKLISANQYLSFKEELKKQGEQYTKVNDSLTFGVPLDPGDTKKGGDVDAVEAYFKNVSAGWSQENFVDNTLGLITTTGIVPKTVISNVRAGIRSGNPEQAFAAADMIEKIRITSPKSTADFDSKDLSFAKQVVGFVSSGVPREKAIELVTKNVYQTTDAEKAVYQAAFKEVQDKSGAWLDNMIDEEIDEFWFMAQPKATMSMTAEFDALTKSYVATTGGDVETARQLAWDDMQRVWGGTEIGPEGKQMFKYSPEVIYGNGYGKSDWVTNQFKSDTKGLNEPFITYDAQTARERYPSYPVMHKDENGRFVPFLIDGIPQRWKPNMKESEEYKAFEAEKASAVERAKQERAGILSGETFDREMQEAIEARFP